MYHQSTLSFTQTQINTRFLKHIGFGEQNEAEEMLRINSNLALIAGDLIDCAGRHFKQITGFQYAIWALDWHMWKMLQQYLSKEAIQQQIHDFEYGAWIKEHGRMVSWEKLIDALQVYVDNYDKWDYKHCSAHWCQQVGGAQLMLPAHAIQEYSRKDRSFDPCPQFNEIMLPRHEDWTVAGWFEQNSGCLGDKFAWGRSSLWWRESWESTGDIDDLLNPGGADEDRNAVAVLLNRRIKQRSQLFLQYGVTEHMVAKTQTEVKPRAVMG